MNWDHKMRSTAKNVVTTSSPQLKKTKQFKNGPSRQRWGKAIFTKRGKQKTGGAVKDQKAAKGAQRGGRNEEVFLTTGRRDLSARGKAINGMRARDRTGDKLSGKDVEVLEFAVK